MKTNGYYNGWSASQRNGANAAIRVAEADGTIPVPTLCSVCGEEPTTGLQRHSEDYRKPLQARPICRGCHIRLHARFRHPDRWKAFIAGLPSDGWYQALTVDPKSLTRPYDETYPGGV